MQSFKWSCAIATLWSCGACQSSYRSGGDYQFSRVTVIENQDPLYWRIFGEQNGCTGENR